MRAGHSPDHSCILLPDCVPAFLAVAQLVEQQTPKPDRGKRPLVIVNGYKGVFFTSLVCVG